MDIEDKDLIREFRRLSEEAARKVRYINQNKFVFLTSNPLKPVTPKHHGGLYIQRDLREWLIDDLRNSGKHILVHFDLLNRNILKELFLQNKG